MAFFKKKNQKAEEVEQQKKDPAADLKAVILNALNDKLNGTLYDDCVIMPKGYTVDVQVSRHEVKDEIHIMQVVFIIKNDEFDEPLIEPVDAQGTTEEEAAKMSVDIFFGSVWHPLDQSMTKKNPVHISVDYLRQHYDFDMYCQSVVRIGVKDKQPTMLVNFIKDDIPKYLGSKKYYWIRMYLAKFKEKKIIEVRVNGSVCSELNQRFKEYIDSWEDTDNFICEKQYAIFVQREEDKCPFKKEVVVNAAREAISSMEKIANQDDYLAMMKRIEEITGDKSLASEIRIFVPEILAKLTLGYREGDNLYLIEDDGNGGQSSIEFKKTQLRSYFYIQQVLIEYLSKRPSQENVSKIVTNSVAFREMRKVMDSAKEKGQEVKPADMYVPGTSYRIAADNYKVW